MLLSSGDILDEKLLTVEHEAPEDWSFYIMDSLDDLIGIITFESILDDQYGGVCLLTLIDLAAGEVVHMRSSAYLSLLNLHKPALTRACAAISSTW